LGLSLQTSMTERKVSHTDYSRRYLILAVSGWRNGGGVNWNDLRKANPSTIQMDGCLSNQQRSCFSLDVNYLIALCAHDEFSHACLGRLKIKINGRHIHNLHVHIDRSSRV
jgi:hypothetical protein